MFDFAPDPKNVKFQTDMNAWSKVSNRTFIWNYITNFGKQKLVPLEYGTVMTVPLEVVADLPAAVAIVRRKLHRTIS